MATRAQTHDPRQTIPSTTDMTRTQAASLAFLLTLAGTALAQDSDEYFSDERGIRDRWTLALGGVFASADTTIKIRSESLGLGESIDLEQDLGFDTSAEDAFLQARVRIRPKHALGFTLYDFRRSAGFTISEDLEIGDDVFSAGSTLSSSLEHRVIQLEYDWSFFKRGKWEAGLRAGIVYLETSLDSSGVTDMGEMRRTANAQQFPVPSIGVQFEYAPAERLIVAGGIAGIGADVGGVDGTFLDARLGLIWFPWRHVGFDLSYHLEDIDLAEGGDLDWDLGYEWDGATATLKFAW